MPRWISAAQLTASTRAPGAIDPEAWAIADGKPYATCNKADLEQWRNDQAASIAAADRAWASAPH